MNLSLTPAFLLYTDWLLNLCQSVSIISKQMFPKRHKNKKPPLICNSVGCRIATVADVRNPLSVPTRGIFPSFPHSSRSLCRTSVPPFLMRSRQKAIRVNGRVLSISLQGEALLQQLAVVGGNKTGVFVHQVTEGTAAHTVGIGPGAQIVEVGWSVPLHSFWSFCRLWGLLSWRRWYAGEVRAEPEGSENGAGGFHFGGGHVGSWPGHGPLSPLPPAAARW